MGDSNTRDDAAARAQALFAALASETRRPGYGEWAREWVRTLLLRAEAAGLYQPEEAP